MHAGLEFNGSVAQERDLIQNKRLKNIFKNWKKTFFFNLIITYSREFMKSIYYVR